MKSMLTDKQCIMVEEMIPYVSYVLQKLIPYVPVHLKEDARSVAYEALCKSAILYDGVRASFKTYAIQSMRNSVMKYLVKESTYSSRSGEGTNNIIEQTEDLYRANNVLDIMIDRESLKEIYQSNIIDDEMRDAFLLLSEGLTVAEISEYLCVPLPNLRNRLTKARQRIIRSGRWAYTSKSQRKNVENTRAYA